MSYLFKHRTIRRFCVSGFEFKNFELRLQTEEEREQFISIVEGLPKIESIHIVEVNEEARAAMETPITAKESTVVRGAMGADDILTAKDRERIAQSNLNGNTLAPNPSKPTGFNMASLNMGGAK